jgi:hypothetical protein
MKVITKKVVQMTDDPAVYLPVSEDSYQYSGPVELAVGYTVSGTIVDGSTNPISGVTVACTGQTSATTGAPGTFSFGGLTGTVTVTPTKTGWTFVPVNIVETTTDLACNFVGTQSSLATPTFSPVAGLYAGTQTVTLTSANATHFFYSVDGTTPTEVGGVAGPSTFKILAATTVQVPHGLTLKALAYDSTATYLDSAVGSAVYKILAISAISPSSAQIDEAGQTLLLAGGVVTGGTTNVTDWSSSVTGVATVGAHTGLVTAVAPGLTVITAASDEVGTLTTTATIQVGSVAAADVTFISNFFLGLIKGVASPFEATQQTAIQTAVAHMQTGTLTTADLNLLQSILNVQYQQLNTAGPYQAGQLAAVKQALADIRSLL